MKTQTEARRTLYSRLLDLLFVSFLLSVLIIVATAPAYGSIGSRPDLVAHPLTALPVLDGKVRSDSAWNGAQAATGFVQSKPNEGQPATQRTSVFVGFTEDSLYIAAILHDDNPAAIVTSDSRRDADLDESDSFQLIIDGFADGQNGLVFGTNAAGIQYDGQLNNKGSSDSLQGSSSFNRDWDTTWEVATHVSENGWSLEMEIPFKSLRYSSKELSGWGINFQRNIRRNNEQAYWAPLARHHTLFRVSDAGQLIGVQAPKQRNFKLTPYALARARQGDEISGTDQDNEIGFDLKYSITPSLTLDASYNTDFAQVEVDDVVVNLDRFSVFLPEKRTFFLENAGQFSVGSSQDVELFFSRRIGISNNGSAVPIEGGLRLSGKLGNSTNIGLLHMRTEEIAGVAPQNDYSVARVNQELKNRSAIGAIYVQRDGDTNDDVNRTYGVDGRMGIGENILVSGYLAKTDTNNRDGKDHAGQLKFDYSSERWFNSFSYTEVGDDFNPEVGFVARRNFKRFNGLFFHRYRPENLWGLQELRPHISYRHHRGFDGEKQSTFLHVDNHFEFKTGLEFHTGVNFRHENVTQSFELAPGRRVPVGRYDVEEAQLVFFTNQGAPLSFEIDVVAGGFFSGDRVTLNPEINYRIGERFNSELSWNYNRIDLDNGEGKFDINVGSLKLAYSFTPKMSLESIFQYDDRFDSTAINLRFAWLQSANAGLYVVYNEQSQDVFGINREQRELIVKFSYIFDVL
ncbi:MAG: DUF5916 domain-containing protein [Pseudomonadales bacterium]